jgi:hypothetical protein
MTGDLQVARLILRIKSYSRLSSNSKTVKPENFDHREGRGRPFNPQNIA